VDTMEPLIIDGEFTDDSPLFAETVAEDGDDWQLVIFREIVAESEFDPDVYVHIEMPLKARVASIAGATPTNFTPEMAVMVNELLAGDEAGRLWLKFQDRLREPEQIALGPGPAVEPDLRE